MHQPCSVVPALEQQRATDWLHATWPSSSASDELESLLPTTGWHAQSVAGTAGATITESDEQSGGCSRNHQQRHMLPCVIADSHSAWEGEGMWHWSLPDTSKGQGNACPQGMRVEAATFDDPSAGFSALLMEPHTLASSTAQNLSGCSSAFTMHWPEGQQTLPYLPHQAQWPGGQQVHAHIPQESQWHEQGWHQQQQQQPFLHKYTEQQQQQLSTPQWSGPAPKPVVCTQLTPPAVAASGDPWRGAPPVRACNPAAGTARGCSVTYAASTQPARVAGAEQAVKAEASEEPRRRRKHKSSTTTRLVPRQVEEAERKLQELQRLYSKERADNTDLKRQGRSLILFLQQLDQNDALCRMAPPRSPSNPHPIPASCSAVSFSQLPHSSQWDPSWVERVQALCPQDLLMLRRQWLEQSALLLPAAELGGMDSPAAKKLVVLHSKHISLTQGAVSLIPEVWLNIGQYSLETLTPISAPDPKWLADLFRQLFDSDITYTATNLSKAFSTKSKQLCQEFDLLLHRYQRLMLQQGLKPQPQHGCSSTAPGHGYSDMRLHFNPCHAQRAAQHAAQGGSSALVNREAMHPGTVGGTALGYEDPITELDCVAEGMQVVTQKQLRALKQFLCDMQHARPVVGNVKLALVTWPLSLNAVDFSKGLVPDDG